MTIKSLLLLSTCCFIFSCQKGPYLQPYEMTVTLVDAAGKPIKGRKLNLITGYDHGKLNFTDGIKDSLLTDNAGKAVFTYDIKSSDAFDISSFNAAITVAEDSVFVAVNSLKHGLAWSGSQTYATDRVKLLGTIRMDSLVPFKMSVKVSKPNINFTLDLMPKGVTSAEYEANKTSQQIDKHFIKLNADISSSPLDTILTGRVYSKMTMNLFLGHSNGTLFTSASTIIDAAVDRNKVFVVNY
jgi:hypothetical protein